PKEKSYLGWNFSLTIPTEVKTDSTLVIRHIPKSKDAHVDRKLNNNIKITEPTKACRYYIIIDAFSIYENAVRRKAEIDALDYSGQIIQGKLNYVAINCFDNKEEAERNKKIIQTTVDGCQSAWILER